MWTENSHTGIVYLPTLLSVYAVGDFRAGRLGDEALRFSIDQGWRNAVNSASRLSLCQRV